MTWDYDVIVVGAGPGGSAAARFCAQKGLKTLLIEKERLPRYKACGGCLSVKTFRLLDLDLKPVIENVVYGAKFTFCMRDPLFIPSEEPIGYLVMRDRFDQFLVQKALEQGANLLDGEKVVKAVDQGDAVEVELAGGKRLSCGYLVGADGAASTVAKSIFPSAWKNSGAGIGLESEIPLELVKDFPKENLHLVHLDFGRIPNGYGWVFPKREVLSIGVGRSSSEKGGATPYRHLTEFIRELPYLKEKKKIRVIAHVLPCFHDEGQRVSKQRVLLVGDAASMMDPLTGEGIYYALRSGMLAAEAILESKEKGNGPAAQYQRVVQQVVFEDLKWALHVSRVIYTLTRLSYRTLKQYPELGQLCLEMLAGRTTYQAFVIRVKECIKNLLKGRVGEKIRNVLARP